MQVAARRMGPATKGPARMRRGIEEGGTNMFEATLGSAQHPDGPGNKRTGPNAARH
jgi:hypothetical protein